MNIDIKSILILVFLGLTLIFGYKWYFNGSDGLEDENKRLKAENELIQKKRDSLELARVTLEKEFNILRQNDSLKSSEISRLDKLLSVMVSELNRTRGDFNKIKKELEETRKKIEDLKNNPPNRTGDDLINSLKNKIK